MSKPFCLAALVLLLLSGWQMAPSLALNKVDTHLIKKTTAEWLKAKPKDKELVGLSIVGALEQKQAYKGPKGHQGRLKAAKKISVCIDYIAKGLIQKKIKPVVVGEAGFLCAINSGFVKK
ncbi:MAG: hypothetical protein IV090_24790 [Candidatus Sericytochromatia bacterium]|nr:hypothetical protein [Candidatus Sericytochromatia bacterium]